MRILLVDDDPAILTAFQKRLELQGYAVTTAADFDQALARLDQDIEVVLADIVLDDRTGIDLLEEVQRRDLICPVIIFSGQPSLESAQEAVRLGAYDYLTKPIRSEQLLKTVEKALEQRQLREDRLRYRATLEATLSSVQDAIITVDGDLRLLMANEAAARTCGVESADTARPVSELQQDCDGGCLDQVREAIRTAQSGTVHRMECGGPAGRQQVVTVSTSPLFMGGGRISGATMVIRDETRLHALEGDMSQRRRLFQIVGGSPAFQALYSQIENLADYDATVLITGESGTGKELVADALHRCGKRSEGPLVKINCAAVPESLLSSELFGHVKGAFTGAIKDKPGKFEEAHGGTLFLDEIGDIPAATQISLLRVLQDKRVERMGANRSTQVDVRIVAATNQDLQAKVREGTFREDLYFRLKVAELRIPPLREHKEDIELLAGHFLERFSKQNDQRAPKLSRDTLKHLMTYHWPGNIRELQHALEYAAMVCAGDTITVGDLPTEIQSPAPGESALPPQAASPQSERERILAALNRTDWNKAKAARILSISRATLYRKIAQLDLVRGESTEGAAD